MIKKSGVYCIFNQINKKMYIGSATNFKSRKYTHFKSLKDGTHHSTYLQNAYNKYGKSNFVFVILEFVDKDNLLVHEQMWINKFNFTDLYNLCPVAGSRLGHKIADADINAIPVYQIDAETNKIIKKWENAYKAAKKLNIEPENILKVCRKEISKGWQRKRAGNYFWSFTKEYEIPTVIRGGDSQKVKIHKVCPKTNVILETYNGIACAAKENNISCGNIGMVCNGLRKTAGNFIWKYDSHEERSSNVGKNVIQIDRKNGNITFYNTMTEAAKESGVPFSTINKICNETTKRGRYAEFYYAFI